MPGPCELSIGNSQVVLASKSAGKLQGRQLASRLVYPSDSITLGTARFQ